MSKFIRKLRLRTGGSVKLELSEPILSDRSYVCYIRIIGKPFDVSIPAHGSDGIQCIYLALRMAAEILYSSDDYMSNNLYWVGASQVGDLGLPRFA